MSVLYKCNNCGTVVSKTARDRALGICDTCIESEGTSIMFYVEVYECDSCGALLDDSACHNCPKRCANCNEVAVYLDENELCEDCAREANDCTGDPWYDNGISQRMFV